MTETNAHWIGGKPQDGQSDRSGPVFNPATGKETARVAFASVQEVDRAVDVAKKTRKVVRTNAQLNKRIGKRIRQERERRNLSLPEVADRTGITVSQLSQIELGRNAGSVWALVRIAKALGLHISKLLSDV